ncbi:hypothetical protein SAMN05216188_101480 [Lentzea xinjiangensis]|uniref:Uncharacterized protein n=1 Tax=Lentzea xinjiangensis TaxID=402600 RepID=A0A1H9AP74_9PSEU|nr:hypothetical protein [Lentzea xinjiangensis]SEP78574.1 hypothetical protein SAMN05216188_101480 [Lentzea xinjiangensis]
MTPTPPTGAAHARRRCSTSGTGIVVLAVTAFVFTGWMIAYGYSPVIAVATASALLAVTATVSRSRPFSARFGPLPPANPVVFWQDDQR